MHSDREQIIQALNKFHDSELQVEDKRHILDQDLRGLQILTKTLKSDPKNGLLTAHVDENRKAFGDNILPSTPMKSFWEMFWESFEDETLRVLIVAACISLVIGIYEFITTKQHKYIEGLAIFIAIFLVAIVTTVNNHSKETQFQKLNEASEDVPVKVIRQNQQTEIKSTEIVVGDIVVLQTGDKVPADGVMISDEEVLVDESTITGEPEPRSKTKRDDCFLISSTSLNRGVCKIVVTSVGINSYVGQQRAKLQEGAGQGDTPLQEKLDTLAGEIGNMGTMAAYATFAAMIVIWIWRADIRENHIYKDPKYANSAKCEDTDEKCNQLVHDVSLMALSSIKLLFWNKYFFKYVLNAFIMAVTIVVVAVPEGLPLAVTLSLAYSTRKMMDDNNLIRVLDAVETMGNATTLCSDKTGTLTKGEMTVTVAYVKDRGLYEELNFDNRNVEAKSFSQRFLSLKLNMMLNSTAVLMDNKGKGVSGSGNSSEVAFLKFLKDSGDYRAERERYPIKKNFLFDSDRKCSSVIVSDSSRRFLYCKGGHDTILNKCIGLSKEEKADLIIRGNKYCEQGKRVFAFAHREDVDICDRPEEVEKLLTFDGMIGIHDPLRDETKNAVKECQAAGIVVRMITGDNIETAKAIAQECGILTKGGKAREGAEIRRMSTKELDDILPTLQVIARATPEDKYIIVSRLNGNLNKKPENASPKDALKLPGFKEDWEETRKEGNRAGLKKEVVGVTGDGTNDAQALKTADVGLAMASGTDVAKDAADIIILDNNFASCIQAVVWGRCTFDNIRKFLQFQLTVNAVALTFTFIAACRGEDPPLNAVMMLWVNLIMDTFGALALGTESPNQEKLLQRLPFKRDASLISDTMWRNIFVQTCFQLAVLLFLQGASARDLFNAKEKWDSSDLSFKEKFGAENAFNTYQEKYIDTVIFNVFVLCQVFNELNSRSIDDDDYNILSGMQKNLPFITIIVITLVAQYLWVAFGGDFISTVPLSTEHWKKCTAIASVSLTLGYIMRLIPIGWIATLKNLLKMEDAGADAIELSDFQRDIQKKASKSLNESRQKNEGKNLIRRFFNYVFISIVFVGPYIAFKIVCPECELYLRRGLLYYLVPQDTN